MNYKLYLIINRGVYSLRTLVDENKDYTILEHNLFVFSFNYNLLSKLLGSCIKYEIECYKDNKLYCVLTGNLKGYKLI